VGSATSCGDTLGSSVAKSMKTKHLPIDLSHRLTWDLVARLGAGLATAGQTQRTPVLPLSYHRGDYDLCPVGDCKHCSKRAQSTCNRTARKTCDRTAGKAKGRTAQPICIEPSRLPDRRPQMCSGAQVFARLRSRVQVKISDRFGSRSTDQYRARSDAERTY
jgi:hypothetical protein